MHELPILESILKVALAHAKENGVGQVVAINLRVGVLSELEDEWMQRYFDHVSKNTIAQGAKLRIERTPVVLRCNACGASYEPGPSCVDDAACPACKSKDKKMISGKGYFISNMEVR